MLSDLQRLSKDLIIYSVIAADFEKPDFKNDALAGVRANFFNSNCAPQSEKTDISIDGRVFGLFYSMKKNEPLSWKMKGGERPFQTVTRAGAKSYCVVFYGENGVVRKRVYFDFEHNWLRTEYYDSVLSGVMLGSLSPKTVNRVCVLVYEHTNELGEKKKELLYPSVSAPKKRCAGLIYSNSGMIWYDASFRPAEITESDEREPGGFVFELSLFNSENESDLNLFDSEYLSEADIEKATEEVEEQPVEHSYSAYERIEQILYEAHKTNKNIFGEIVSHPFEEQSESGMDEESAAEEAAEAPAEADEAPEYKQAEEEKPSLELDTEGGVYSYYGAVDENGMRTGKGRIVSPDGVTVYDGGYSDDKREGFGVCYYKDGSPNYVGGWKQGGRNGSGVGFRRSDGTMHVGKWSNNAPVDIGARFDSKGNFIDVCGYSGGVKHGKAVSFDDAGNVVIKTYADGELVRERVITDGE